MNIIKINQCPVQVQKAAETVGGFSGITTLFFDNNGNKTEKSVLNGGYIVAGNYYGSVVYALDVDEVIEVQQ